MARVSDFFFQKNQSLNFFIFFFFGGGGRGWGGGGGGRARVSGKKNCLLFDGVKVRDDWLVQVNLF